MLLIIPLPLFFTSTVFGRRGLEAWVVIGMIWAFASAFTVILYPLWESRRELGMISKGMVKVRFG
jgi:urea-proton symporter